jgi:LysM repeat protein
MIRSSKAVLLLVICHLSLFAKHKIITGEEYIATFKDNAIREMLMYDIPASITLAQGMLESDNGNSDLAIYANNHFGIKCHVGWEGPCFIKDDDEKDECFRKYPSVLDSYTDHSIFLKSRPRYAQLFELNHTDYKGWAKGLKEAGYATDPRYTKRLLELIEKYALFKYDVIQVQKEAIAKNTIHKEENVDNHKTDKIIINKNTGVKHEIFYSGIIKYIIIKPGDTFFNIAKETDKDLWQLYKYNDLNPGDKLIEGQKLYLQPKHKKAGDPFHIVKKGDTMTSISQLYGIKLKSLYKKNNMKLGEEPKIGELIYMRSKKRTQ